jgi:hypothetical protein
MLRAFVNRNCKHAVACQQLRQIAPAHRCHAWAAVAAALNWSGTATEVALPSMTILASTWPMPSLPSAFETIMPVKPISPNPAYNAWPKLSAYIAVMVQLFDCAFAKREWLAPAGQHVWIIIVI